MLRCEKRLHCSSKGDSDRSEITANGKLVSLETLKKQILDNKVSHDFVDLLKSQNGLRQQLLTQCMLGNQPDTAKVILDHIVNNVSDKEVWRLIFPYFGGCSDVKLVNKLWNGFEEDEKRELALATDEERRTCLHWAAISGHQETCSLIFEQLEGVDMLKKVLPIQDKIRKTALHYASRNGHNTIVEEIIRKLRDHEMLMGVVLMLDSMDNIALHSACYYGHKKVVESLTACLQEAELLTVCKMQEVNDMTPLHFACQNGHKEIVVALANCLGAGGLFEVAMVKSVDTNWTCMHWICERGYVEICKFILEYMTNITHLRQLVTEEDVNGQTCFHLACRCNNFTTVRLIMEHLKQLPFITTLLTMQDDETFTAPLWACLCHLPDVLEAIIDNASETILEKILTLQDRYNRNPLHWICKRGYDDLFYLFVGNMTNTQLLEKLLLSKDNKNKSPIQYAFEGSNFDIFAGREMLSFFTKPLLDAPDRKYILKACQRGAKDAVLNILKAAKQIDNNGYELRDILNARDEEGKTLLHIACNRGDQEMVKGLLQHVQNLHSDFISKEAILLNIDLLDQTALHEACQQGNNQIIQMILDSSEKSGCLRDMLLAKSKKFQTALGEAFAHGDYNNVKTILHEGAVANCVIEMLASTNKEGQTLFHRACQYDYEHVKCLDAVVKAGIKAAKKSTNKDALVEVLRQQDSSGRTFLFFISSARNDVIHLLIDTITHFEASTFCSDKIHCHWFLTVEDKKGKTAIQCVKQLQMPCLKAFMNPFLDTIKTGKKEIHEDFQGSANLWYTDQEWKKGTENDTFLCGKKNKISDFHLFHETTASDQYRTKKKKSLLTALGKAYCLDLINHEYTESYLKFCWRAHSRYFYFTNLFLYFMLLLSLSAYVASHEEQEVVPQPSVVVNESLVAENGTYDHGREVIVVSFLPRVTITSLYLMLAFSLGDISNELIQMIAKRAHYWHSPDNYADLSVCLGCLAISIHGFCVNPTKPSLGLYQFSIALMIIAWINACWMMTKLPSASSSRLQEISLMFIMLFKVIKRVCIFVPVFGIFTVTFALGFHSAFQYEVAFSHLGYSIMKTIAMTIGELDFADMFAASQDKEVSSSEALGCLLFIVFLGIMTISAMNYITAMAVGDLVELREHSEVLSFRILVDLTLESQALLALFSNLRKDDARAGLQQSDYQTKV